MKKPLILAGAAVGGALAALAANEVRLGNRYRKNPDESGGGLFDLPAGTPFEVAGSRGATLRGERVGSGRPVVLVHGWVERRQVWAAAVRLLVDAGFEAITYDQRGHGESTRGDVADPRIEWLGDDLGLVLESLDLSDAIVVGHSMGGMAAQACVGRARDNGRVSGVALVTTTAKRVRPIVPRAGTVFGPLAEWYLKPDVRGAVRIANICGPTPSLVHAQGVRDCYLSTARNVRLDWHFAMERMELSDFASAITQPTYILAGSHDPLTPPKCSHRLNELIPHAKLEVLEGKGHQLQWEAPARIVEIVQDLAQSPSGSH